MLWKQSYRTRILRDLGCPDAGVTNLDGSPNSEERQVWIAGFGFDAIADQGVWWRLFQSEFPRDENVKKAFIFDKVLPSTAESALAMIPKSEGCQCLLVEDPLGAWKSLVTPDADSRGFAGILERDRIALMMIGPPTEDAWEEFSNFWRVRT